MANRPAGAYSVRKTRLNQGLCKGCETYLGAVDVHGTEQYGQIVDVKIRICCY